MLLGSVLFLTGVWGEGSIAAGLMIAPGPLTVALLSFNVNRLTARFGSRPVIVAGCLCFVAGATWWRTQLTATPDYAADFLPGMLIGGTGVALTQASLFTLATGVLPASRLSTGSGVLNMSRQIGLALGVAILVALDGLPAGLQRDDRRRAQRGRGGEPAPSLSGSAAVTTVPRPGGLVTESVPPAASARSRSPSSPVPSAWSAPPAPSSDDRHAEHVAVAPGGDAGDVGIRVLGDVGERLGDDVVRRPPRRARAAAPRTARRARPAPGCAWRAPPAHGRGRGRRGSRGGGRGRARAARRARCPARARRRRAGRRSCPAP